MKQNSLEVRNCGTGSYNVMTQPLTSSSSPPAAVPPLGHRRDPACRCAATLTACEGRLGMVSAAVGAGAGVGAEDCAARTISCSVLAAAACAAGRASKQQVRSKLLHCRMRALQRRYQDADMITCQEDQFNAFNSSHDEVC